MTPDGTLLPVPPDPETMREIAELSGGRAFQVEDADELAGLYEDLGSRVATENEEREITAAFAAGGLACCCWRRRWACGRRRGCRRPPSHLRSVRRGMRTYRAPSPRRSPRPSLLNAWADGDPARDGGALDRSVATVRYWLERWQIGRAGPSPPAHDDPATAPARVATALLAAWADDVRPRGSRQLPLQALPPGVGVATVAACQGRLVAEAGGRCALAGYERCVGALQFHHRDPG